MRRMLLLAAALAIPVSGASVAALGSPAFAAGVKITCTTITGNAASTITVSGCTGGNTGGASKPIVATSLASCGTITWVSNTTTTLGPATLKSTSAKKCPGYVKGGTNNPTADNFSAAVTGDSGNGLKVPGKATGAVCISHSGDITALKPTKAT